MSVLFAERGGEGSRLLVLLHGLGATAAVWHPFIRILEREWQGRWIAPDFRGHGRSVKEGPYDFAQHARDIGALLANETADEIVPLGHSFGGVISALLGSGEFGVSPRASLAFGVKIRWSEDEKNKALDLAKRPAKIFAARDEAVERYLKMAGIFGLIDPSSPGVETGIVAADGGWKIAQEPATFSAVDHSVPDALRRAKPPLRLAAGANDPMTTLDDMRALDPNAFLFENAGHNVHVEAPEKVWQFVKRVLEERR
ncbi:MAG: alpha/beta hydrolase [Xanthobacteraceae bacterium]|nr:alpha/beta hydrolase [Xanthobacteraceae bacterium]